MSIVRIVTLGLVLAGVGTTCIPLQAQAQYYPPPGGGYDRGYDRPPPPPPPYGYGGPGYGRPPPPGFRCDAHFRTPYGPRQIVCPMGRPRPIGEFCQCPGPDPYAPPARGHIIP